jgi:flagellar biosynthesis protein FlhG
MNQASTLKKLKDGSIKADSFGERFRKKLESDDASRMVVCFSSGKGGVGKTTLVINTAQALSRHGKRVMILDGDLGLANIDVMLGLTPEYSLEHVISGEKNLEDIIIHGPDDIMLLPASSGVTSMTSLGESEKLFLLNEFSRFSLPVDIMLVDSPAGIAENVVYFNMAAQHRVIIITPEPTSVTDAYALIKILSTRHKIKHFSLLINMVKNEQEAKMIYRQFTSVTDRFLGTLSLGYLGYIPKSAAITEAVRRQATVMDRHPETAEYFTEIAGNILDLRTRRHIDGNIRFFWNHILGH